MFCKTLPGGRNVRQELRTVVLSPLWVGRTHNPLRAASPGQSPTASPLGWACIQVAFPCPQVEGWARPQVEGHLSQDLAWVAWPSGALKEVGPILGWMMIESRGHLVTGDLNGS